MAWRNYPLVDANEWNDHSAKAIDPGHHHVWMCAHWAHWLIVYNYEMNYFHLLVPVQMSLVPFIKRAASCCQGKCTATLLPPPLLNPRLVLNAHVLIGLNGCIIHPFYICVQEKSQSECAHRFFWVAVNTLTQWGIDIWEQRRQPDKLIPSLSTWKEQNPKLFFFLLQSYRKCFFVLLHHW